MVGHGIINKPRKPLTPTRWKPSTLADESQFVSLCTQSDTHPLYNEKCQRPCVADKKETPAVVLALRRFREAYPPKIEVATSINLIIFVTN